MWKPNQKGIEELVILFSNSKGIDNTKHKEVYQKINEYSRNTDFCKYLIYILNEESIEIDIRQISGLTLKSIIEKDISSISEDSSNYLRENILKHYLHDNVRIRKTISIIVNTFVKQDSLENWPELLDFLYNSLETEKGVEMSLEMINLIIEDSGCLLEEKFDKFIIKYIPKLRNSLQNFKTIHNPNEKLFCLVLQSIEYLFENCPNIMMNYLESISNEITNLHDTTNFNIRYRIGRVWMSIIKFNSEVLILLFDNLFNFFLNNLIYDHYELNFNTCDFFNLILQNNGALLKNQKISDYIKGNLSILIPRIMVFMRLTQNDLCGIDSSYKSNERNKEEDEEEDEEKMDEGLDYYNPNFTLRKCASKIIDSLSNIYPKEVYENIKLHLDSGMQNQDWLVKERTILALGAVGIGSYEFLKPHLNNLILFLINELRNNNKLIRAISCWTLSRFTKFILLDNNVENSNDLFKSYLSETLTRFIDNDPIVQEAACTSFSTMISVRKEVLEPYLSEIFKVICSVFNKYQGSSMLTLYDIISYMTEEYNDHFKNPQLIEDLIKSILQKFYSLNDNDYKNIVPIFDIICSLIKASGELLKGFCKEFLTRAINIIDYSIKSYFKNNKDISFLDRELISKCLELISILCDNLPSFCSDILNQSSIVESMNILLETKDLFLKQYVFALFGDLAKTNNKKIEDNFDNIIVLLIQNLDNPTKNRNDPNTEEKIHTCNNSCWTIGLLSIAYSNRIKRYIDQIMERLLKILCVPRLNKSIAQNIAICIGRMAYSNPQEIGKYMDSFVKHFCLSIRYADDTQEKQEAFIGLCRSIISNPQGLINHLPYFCDAICQYENPSAELNDLFNDLINSYKSSLQNRWYDIFQNFPEKLQKKMIYRFKIE